MKTEKGRRVVAKVSLEACLIAIMLVNCISHYCNGSQDSD